MRAIPAVISRAPGRVCLLGEHQDYLGLPVIAAAIDRHIRLSAVPNGTDHLRIALPDVGAERIIALDDPLSSLAPRDYFGSGLRVFRRWGGIPDRGFDIEVRGELPINAGASSSSALAVAWIQLLFGLYHPGCIPAPAELARAAYEAEVLEHGEPGGMMDHTAIAYGGIVAFHQGDGTVRRLAGPLPGLVLVDSRRPKETLGLLARVKDGALAAVRRLQDADPSFDLAGQTASGLADRVRGLPDDLRECILGAVLTHDLTRAALVEFQRTPPDPLRIGELMTRQHAVLRNRLRTSTPFIDGIVDTALAAGALGAKINGSGGGGTVVILAPGREAEVAAAVRALGPAAWPVRIDPGARLERISP